MNDNILHPGAAADRLRRLGRAEAPERLGVAALDERGDRRHLGRGHDALAAAAVDAYLELVWTIPARTVRAIGDLTPPGRGEYRLGGAGPGGCWALDPSVASAAHLPAGAP